MIQCVLLALGAATLHTNNQLWSDVGSKLGLSSTLAATLHWFLKWVLSVWALFEANWTLNRWADRRWRFFTDKSVWDWKSEVAVVTGGSAGIGAYVVKKLVSHGTRVAVLDVSPLSDVFTKDELALIRFYRCDVTSQDDIRQAAEALRSDFGHPSILVNNAGIGNAWPILDIPYARLQSMFNINVMSHWITVQEFLPDMLKKKKGHIMTVASLASFATVAGAVDYSCAKAAILAFHEGLTLELKHRYNCPEILTSVIHPHWTKSAITAHSSIARGLEKQGGRLWEADDVADTMVKQIVAAKSGQIRLGPPFVSTLRALPTWLQEGIRDSQAYIVTGSGSTGKG
ncbi:hypothetical protein COCMIDRAFT_96648 [Bipolaris oryzae ATCC 44560]|uniref:Short-chain dehydrogenase/reductase 3 n=1 Tax=Bipolaris oryzae ATCC 44560 TaxID=930090 RepID=W6ZC70_COCMI|nr:uncharacterized protein COCMIDRAFT_96648 [Bipolaris oryzae ATCC 44560]EUC45034.1 hypothetical protein COCMIDRAFT_96648 [Bipolaris oryzae ATCC 44560]